MLARGKTWAWPLDLVGTGILCLSLSACDSNGPADLTDETNCPEPREIALGQSLEGELTVGDCQLSAESFRDFTDLWLLVLQDATTIQLQLVSSWYGTLPIELFDAQGRLRGAGSGFVEAELEAGSYLIQVSGPESPYRLAVKLPNDCSPEGELVLGETVLDALTDDDCVLNGTSWPSVFDTWTVDLDDTATVRRTLETSEFGTTLYATGSEGRFEIREFRVESSPTLIEVRASSRQSGARGEYTLRIDLSPQCSPGAVIRLGETIDGEISPSDCFREPSPVSNTRSIPLADSFQLNLEEETEVEVSLETPFSFYASIIDEQGEDLLLISQAFAPDGNRSAVLPAGGYTLWVGTQGSFIANWVSLGGYRLSIQEIP